MTIEEAEQVIEAAVQKHLAEGGEVVAGVWSGRKCCALGAVAQCRPRVMARYQAAMQTLDWKEEEVDEFTWGFDGYGSKSNASIHYALGKKFRAKYLEAK